MLFFGAIKKKIFSETFAIVCTFSNYRVLHIIFAQFLKKSQNSSEIVSNFNDTIAKHNDFDENQDLLKKR